jgi:hypothetical protein
MRRAWALVLLAALPAWGQVYKCVDKNGVTHYTDTPPPGCRGGAVEIRPIPSVSGAQAAPRGEDFARQDAEFKRRQNERAAVDAQEQASQEARCGSLRREHAALSPEGRLWRFNDQGERVYVPDEVRDQRLAQVREALRGCP